MCLVLPLTFRWEALRFDVAKKMKQDQINMNSVRCTFFD